MRYGRPVALFFVLTSILFFALLANPVLAKPGHKAAPGQGNVLVGAASRSVLPLVDGGYDYLKAGFPDRSDPDDPGIPVPAWDDGRIAVL